MKTRSTLPQAAVVLTAKTPGNETLQQMKRRLRGLRLILIVCSLFAATAVFGQPVIRTWTNQNPAQLTGGGDMNVAANYDPNGVPTPMTPTPDADGNYGDQILFDGKTTGPLMVTQSGGTLGGFGGQAYPAGVRIVLTSNQTSSVMIYSVLAVSGGMRVNYFLMETNSGGFMLGDGGPNCFDVLDGEQNGQWLPNRCAGARVVPVRIRTFLRAREIGLSETT